MPSHSILILAGEASGDYHAAAMLRDLKLIEPDVTAKGIGGDMLRDAGMELLFHYRDINTIGLNEGLARFGTILRAYRTVKHELEHGGHKLFIPVDYPDVNLRLCRFAKAAGVSVCYYISPQVWAWRRGRIRKIARRVDRMMTIFPFEEAMYRQAGVSADFVGHTMVRDIPEHRDKRGLREELGLDPERYSVALVPGSRPAEVSRVLPRMCEAARLFAARFPETRFALPLAGDHLLESVKSIVSQSGLDVAVLSRGADRVMAACDSGLVTSGTATLQAALVGMPHAVVYVMDNFSWWLAIRVFKPLLMAADVHVAMANVLALKEEKQPAGPLQEMLAAGFNIPCQECGRPLFVPELLQDAVTPQELAGWLTRFKTEAPLTQAMIRGFSRLREVLAAPGEDHTPARIVQEALRQT